MKPPPDLLRYLDAIERRLDQLPDRPRPRFRQPAAGAALRNAATASLRAVGPTADEDAEAIDWMLEELRISFCAQALGTSQPVSEKRILREIDRWWSEAG